MSTAKPIIAQVWASLQQEEHFICSGGDDVSQGLLGQGGIFTIHHGKPMGGDQLQAGKLTSQIIKGIISQQKEYDKNFLLWKVSKLDVIKHRKEIKIKMYFPDITAKGRKR